MSDSTRGSARVSVDGKFFRLGPRKFHVKGITYGPFAPGADGETFASPAQTARDFKLIRELGANVLRVYYPPPAWFLDLAGEHGLKVFVDVPWPKHLCFLDSRKSETAARDAVRRAAQKVKGHPAIFALSVVNEISSEIVRWSGVARVERFIDSLIQEVKNVDPDCLCTFASFPPTEFLQSESIDFVCFNVYLHQPKTFESYLARLQTLADSRPLVLGEFGMDSIREGEARKSEFLSWQIELASRAGLAGTVLFSFTDDWYRGGMQIEDWGFGLTTRDRNPKPSFHVVQQQYAIAPYYPVPRAAKASVVVATYNGARTLQSCLESLTRLNYPDYEVIVVDDGSRDATPDIAKQFPSIRYIRQENQGLSAARNAGIRAAQGEIVAFTDDDCRADEDWLYYIVSDLLRGDFAGIGGHNFLPPEDSPVAAAVVVSPGGPAHVLLTDREAEHIPGCNMAFHKWALEEIGMFDPLYRKAGDDVDVCWRLQEHNLKIGFSPAGFVWHFRRPTVKAYLKQQAGYGEAEALLMGNHPEHYNSIGGGLWRGRIYGGSHWGLLLRGAVIYHGVFGSGFFQRLYSPDPVQPLMLCTTLSYHGLINAPLLLLTLNFPMLLPLAAVSLGVSVGTCVLAAAQAKLPRQKRRWWSRPLVALLFFLQPIVRGWARLKWRLNLLTTHKGAATAPAIHHTGELPDAVVYWCDGRADRYGFLNRIEAELEKARWNCRPDSGWATHDLDVPVHLWTRLRLTTVTEELELGRTNLRCRIAGFWSLPAKVLFFGSVALVAAVLGLFAQANPWAWLSLTALPLVSWFFDSEKDHYRRAFAGLIDAVAADHKLVKLDVADV
jgi:O-antigen biosynthesis protein